MADDIIGPIIGLAGAGLMLGMAKNLVNQTSNSCNNNNRNCRQRPRPRPRPRPRRRVNVCEERREDNVVNNILSKF